MLPMLKLFDKTFICNLASQKKQERLILNIRVNLRFDPQDPQTK